MILDERVYPCPPVSAPNSGGAMSLWTMSPVVAQTGTTTLSKSNTWGIATESAQFALCIPAVLGARTAGACRCDVSHRRRTATAAIPRFLYCLDQPHLSSTATGMSTLVQELPLDQRTCQCTQRANKLSKNCTCGIATEQREGHRHQQILRNCPPGAYRP